MYSNPERLEILHLLLVYCSTKRIFTTGERICINQERGKLLMQQYQIENPENLEAINFEHSRPLTAKINFNIMKMKNQNIL